MSTFPAAHIDRQLARTVAWTARLSQWRSSSAYVTKALQAIHFVSRGVFHVWRNRQYYTILKLTNMAMVNIQFHFKTERVIGRPYKMKIESTNICNTHCQLCPTGLNMPGRDKGKMDTEKFKKLVTKFAPTLATLDLSMWGDPLIVPDIFEMIHHAHKKGVWTYISSNLHAFKAHKNQAESLVSSGLDMLTCSLHGASQETYARYQPGKNFEEAVNKVKHIIAVRDRMGSATPVLQLNFVVTQHNEHETAAFQQLADELGCRAVFSAASMNTRFIDDEPTSCGSKKSSCGSDKKEEAPKLVTLGFADDLHERKVKKHLNNWLPKNKEYVLEPYRKMLEGDMSTDDYNGRKIMDCSWPWRSAVINWDGAVSTCCGSWKPEEDLGNVLDSSFASIWNGRKYRMARRSFKNKVAAADTKNNPCATCPGFMV